MSLWLWQWGGSVGSQAQQFQQWLIFIAVWVCVKGCCRLVCLPMWMNCPQSNKQLLNKFQTTERSYKRDGGSNKPLSTPWTCLVVVVVVAASAPLTRPPPLAIDSDERGLATDPQPSVEWASEGARRPGEWVKGRGERRGRMWAAVNTTRGKEEMEGWALP